MNMNLLFLGPSGSGKDTQVDMLKEKIPLADISTGEMFRTLYKECVPLAVEAREYWSKGIFNPDEQVFELLGIWLQRYDMSKSWAFTAAVRRVTQIPMLDEVLAKYDKKLDYVLHFSLSEEVAIERLSLRWVCDGCGANYHEKYKPEKERGICDKCGAMLVQREDDLPEQIKVRLSEYNKTIAPIREEYEKRGIWIEIDASPSIEEIHKVVCEKLNIS